MKIGDRVRVILINGTIIPKRLEDNAENYWKIIGETGTIQQDPSEKSIRAHFSQQPRVLVRFDKDLMMTFGLYSHNNLENSLWILESDLEAFETTGDMVPS